MTTEMQDAILQVRQRIIETVETTVGKAADKLTAARPDINLLSQLMLQWIDGAALTYRDAGFDIGDWKEDIHEWLIKNQFYIDTNIPEPGAQWKVHLSPFGWARRIVLTFALK